LAGVQSLASGLILVVKVQFAPEVTVNPGGGSGWDDAPLDIQIPDDARELDRDVLAYHRELRAQRRRNRLRRLTGPFSGPGTVMPLLASILAVCLVAGAMLSVATFSPSTAPADHHTTRPSASAGAASPAPPRSHATAGSATGGSATGGSATTGSATASSGGTSPAATSPSGTRSVLTSVAASPSGAGSSAAGPSATRASHPAKASASSSASTARASGQVSRAGAG
jgi:hypothetical protein